MMRRIAIVTTCRADYGLLRPLIKAVHEDAEVELQLIVTGMHLSDLHGHTIFEIEADPWPIAARVDMGLQSDTTVDNTKAIGVAAIGFAEALAHLAPDIVVVLGDRFELLGITAAILMARIPIAHIHGGEITQGAMDESIRHAVTKLSSLHFPTTELYRQRIIQMGELPERVFNVGAPTLDTIRTFAPMDRTELEMNLGLKLGSPLFAVTFHPVTLEAGQSRAQCEEMLKALADFPEATLVFTGANADNEGQEIMEAITAFVADNSGRVVLVPSLGHRRYLSLIKIADAVVGNSSSGLLEAPHFKTPTVNIGDRQKGRISPQSVVDCPAEKGAITTAVRRCLDGGFLAQLDDMDNPYGNGTSAQQTLAALKSAGDARDLLQKPFYNLDVLP